MNQSNQLTTNYFLLSERIKNLLRLKGPIHPGALFTMIHHREGHSIMEFTLMTLLFSQELALDGYGDLYEQTYTYEQVEALPRSR